MGGMRMNLAMANNRALAFDGTILLRLNAISYFRWDWFGFPRCLAAIHRERSIEETSPNVQS
jgi:hypothetical protein